MRKKLLLRPMLFNIYKGAETVNVLELAEIWPLHTLQYHIKEAREEGDLRCAAELEYIFLKRDREERR